MCLWACSLHNKVIPLASGCHCHPSVRHGVAHQDIWRVTHQDILTCLNFLWGNYTDCLFTIESNFCSTAWSQQMFMRRQSSLRLGPNAHTVHHQAGRERDKKFFVRVTECWLYGRESDTTKKFNATESLWYKGVETFSSGVETTNWSFQMLVILQETRFAWWQLAPANKRVFIINGHVANSRRANLKSSSVNKILFFNRALSKKVMKVV